MLQREFGKLDREGWQKLIDEDRKAQDPNHQPDPVREEAWRIFLRPYDLAEFAPVILHPLALADMAGAYSVPGMPRWALSLFTPDDARQIKAFKAAQAKAGEKK